MEINYDMLLAEAEEAAREEPRQDVSRLLDFLDPNSVTSPPVRGELVILEESAPRYREGTYSAQDLRSAGWPDSMISDYLVRRSR